jgi:hypothetical protein
VVPGTKVVEASEPGPPPRSESCPPLSRDTYRDRSLFEEAIADLRLVTSSEDFGDTDTPKENLLRRTRVRSPKFFRGLVNIPEAHIFLGKWNRWRTQGTFQGGGLIYGGKGIYGPIVMELDARVRAVGAYAFDDGVEDDSPAKNVHTITLAAKTATRNLKVSECSNLVGDTGFLGVVAEEGLTGEATFSVSGDYFELDHLTIAYLP